jgi:DNA-binding NarL/FixJ family response regulator
MKKRVLIADDHAIVRKGLRQILEENSDITVTAEAVNGQDVLEKMRNGSFDLVLLDISMPGRNGLDVLKDIKASHPGLPVLMLSMYPEEQYAVRALKSGASGYLTKESAPDELMEAVKKVIKGGKYISSSLAEKLAMDLTGGSINPHEMLSDREFQVMAMIASGKAVKEIADELSLSVKTISTYRTRVLEKMNMHNNAEITRYAIENRLV